ncbi:hypothetical protein STEG23_017402 [Scotinomys teguina]
MWQRETSACQGEKVKAISTRQGVCPLLQAPDYKVSFGKPARAEDHQTIPPNPDPLRPGSGDWEELQDTLGHNMCDIMDSVDLNKYSKREIFKGVVVVVVLVLVVVVLVVVVMVVVVMVVLVMVVLVMVVVVLVVVVLVVLVMVVVVLVVVVLGVVVMLTLIFNRLAIFQIHSALFLNERLFSCSQHFTVVCSSLPRGGPETYLKSYHHFDSKVT